MTKDRLYPLASLLLLFLVAPVAALLAAPWVYGLLQQVVAADSVLDAPFHRVTSRLVLVAVAVLLVPAYKLSGMSKADCGLVRTTNRVRLAWLGAGLGVGSMLAVYVPGFLLGVYAPDTGGESTAYLLIQIVQILAGGLFIGVFEEILFRGFILGALRRSLGIVAAVAVSSFFFSIVHFMRPEDPAVTDAWNSGILLLGSLFARAGNSFLQEACTLFCMGLVLSVLCHWTRSVYVAIGLHTGWVWVMMFFRLFTDNQETMVWLYGTNEWISKAWAGPILSLVFLVAVFFTWKWWKALSCPGLSVNRKSRIGGSLS